MVLVILIVLNSAHSNLNSDSGPNSDLESEKQNYLRIELANLVQLPISSGKNYSESTFYVIFYQMARFKHILFTLPDICEEEESSCQNNSFSNVIDFLSVNNTGFEKKAENDLQVNYENEAENDLEVTFKKIDDTRYREPLQDQRPMSHRETCSEVESQSPAKHLVRFKQGSFRFGM